MSLEDALKENTTAMKDLTAALKAGGGAASGGKASADTKPAASGKKTTLDTVAKRYGAFMSAEGDEGKAFVRKVVGHFDVKKISELGEAQFDEALALLDKREAGEDPFASDDDLM